jgi:hypothetical protein
MFAGSYDARLALADRGYSAQVGAVPVRSAGAGQLMYKEEQDYAPPLSLVERFPRQRFSVKLGYGATVITPYRPLA